MLGKHVRPLANKVTEPIALALLKIGLTPNLTTGLGTVITIIAAILLIPTGHLFAAAMVLWLFVMFDMLDGAMARASDSGTRFGAVLDATCDRIADGTIFSCIAWWIIFTMPGGLSVASHRWLLVATFVTLVASQVISYCKARAEASGLNGDGGFIERPERLIIVLVGIGFTGLGLWPSVFIAMWILAVGSVFTVGQRLYWVYRSPGACENPASMTAGSQLSIGTVDTGISEVDGSDPEVRARSRRRMRRTERHRDSILTPRNHEG